MSIWDTEDKMLRQLLLDMGFTEFEEIPYWIQELVNPLIELGWKRKVSQ